MRIGNEIGTCVSAACRFGLNLTVVSLIWFALCRPAAARCEHPPTKWAFGQQFYQTWRTDGDVCKSISNYPENIAAIRITEKAKHGISGKNGRFGVAYKPDPGFKGTDSFAYEVISSENFRQGAGMIATVVITVIVE